MRSVFLFYMVVNVAAVIGPSNALDLIRVNMIRVRARGCYCPRFFRFYALFMRFLVCFE